MPRVPLISFLLSLLCLTFGHSSLVWAAVPSCSAIFTSERIVELPETRGAQTHNFPSLESQNLFRQKLKSGEAFRFEAMMLSQLENRETEIYEALSRNNLAKLNEKQASAFRWYTSHEGSYDSINKYLANPKRGGIDRKAIAPKAQLMVESFKQLSPLPKGLLLFRGMSFDDQPAYTKGQEVKIANFSSTSLAPSVAFEFATRTRNDYQDIWIIEIADNNVSGYFAGNSNEAEIILQNDLVFEVVRVKTLKPEFRTYGQDRVIFLKAKNTYH